MKTLEERFFEKVHINTKNGCWEWTAYKDPNGYGRFRFDGQMRQAHRWSYQQHVGEIPANMCVCHQCDNPRCVNPEHLFLGTHQENMRDMMAKGRHRRSDSAGLRKLCESDVRAVKAMLPKHGRGVCAFLARWFGVSRKTISYIKRGKLWSHVQ